MELSSLAHPATLGLLGTPPLTPNSDVRSITPCSAPAVFRTPRKPSHPQRSTVSESKRDSVIVSFRLVHSQDYGLPSLSISTTALEGSREPRAKRRLFASNYNTLDYSDLLDISRTRKISRLSSQSLTRELRYRCSPDLDGTDADDEMEQTPFSTNYLSPPYSPQEESFTSDTSPSEAPHSQRSRGVTLTPKVKTCASCKTKKTPLWRDSDDGTPYCNACGIRFKKYHVRCSTCFYIPRKDEKINNSCCLCGSRLVHCRHH